MPPKVDPKERLERERARIRKREKTVELSLLGVLVSLTVFPFLFARFLTPGWAFSVSMAFMVGFAALAGWALWDHRKAVREL